MFLELLRHYNVCVSRVSGVIMKGWIMRPIIEMYEYIKYFYVRVYPSVSESVYYGIYFIFSYANLHNLHNFGFNRNYIKYSDNCLSMILSPLEMCAVGGLVRRGARSNVRSESRIVSSTYKRTL